MFEPLFAAGAGERSSSASRILRHQGSGRITSGRLAAAKSRNSSGVGTKNTGSVIITRSAAFPSARWNLVAIPRASITLSRSTGDPEPFENRTVTGTLPPANCSATLKRGATSDGWK